MRAHTKRVKAQIAAAKLALIKTKNPEKKAALKAQLKAANKVLALKKKLAAATTPEKKAAIRAKIVAAKAVLAKASRKVLKASNKVAA